VSATNRPFGFRKLGWRRLVLPVVLLPFTLVGLALGWPTLHAWRTAREIASYRRPMMGMQARGRVRIGGTVTRDQLVTSPLGERGVGWVGAVGYIAKDGDGDTWFEPVCVRGNLSALRIKDFLVEWSLSFVEPHEPAVLGSRSRLQHALPIIDIGTPAEATAPAAIPAEIQRACGTALAATNHTLSYREAVLPDDAHVEVLGCGDGVRISRCEGAGSYLLTTGKVDELVAEQRTGSGFLLLFGGFWNLVILTIVGLSASSGLVRTRPTFQESLRAR
jgi:hypothetical protein